MWHNTKHTIYQLNIYLRHMFENISALEQIQRYNKSTYPTNQFQNLSVQRVMLKFSFQTLSCLSQQDRYIVWDSNSKQLQGIHIFGPYQPAQHTKIWFFFLIVCTLNSRVNNKNKNNWLYNIHLTWNIHNPFGCTLHTFYLCIFFLLVQKIE